MEEKNTNKSVLLEIISNRNKFWSFVSLIAILVSITLILFSTFTKYITKNIDKINITPEGGIIFQLDNKKSAMFLLSPNGGLNSPWVNTGIKLESGDKIRFKYSGKVCIGFHRMVEAALADTLLPPLPWCGAEGIGGSSYNPPRSIRLYEKDRLKFLIAKNKPQGRLIGVICSVKPTHRPNDSLIIDIPENTDGYYSVDRCGTLWLTINDNWLDNEFLSNTNYEDLNMKKEEYDFIKNNSYSNVWYDDNSGSIAVQLEFK